MKRQFYTVTFIDATGAAQESRTFFTVRVARQWAKWIGAWASDVRIMQGGAGGISVV